MGYFDKWLAKHADTIAKIKKSACDLHASVNQTYGNGLPYSVHLNAVASAAALYGAAVCKSEDDLLPMLFAAYYHDSIEDARLTYNNVRDTASAYMNSDQTLLAAEIVYALTNDKGRTRAERAGENYYRGIRETPYAPFIKLCDRYANVAFSVSCTSGINARMMQVYRDEMPHFLEAINAHNTDDCRFTLPDTLVRMLADLVN